MKFTFALGTIAAVGAAFDYEAAIEIYFNIIDSETFQKDTDIAALYAGFVQSITGEDHLEDLKSCRK